MISTISGGDTWMLATLIVRREGRFPPKLKDLRATLRKLTALIRELEPARI